MKKFLLLVSVLFCVGCSYDEDRIIEMSNKEKTNSNFSNLSETNEIILELGEEESLFTTILAFNDIVSYGEDYFSINDTEKNIIYIYDSTYDLIEAWC